MAKGIKKAKLPETDSIDELARFWDTHDLTDFEDELEEAPGSVFAGPRGSALRIDLGPAEADQLSQIARSQGVPQSIVAREWILEKLRTKAS